MKTFLEDEKAIQKREDECLGCQASRLQGYKAARLQMDKAAFGFQAIYKL
jgi:hypothetical protein